MPADSTNGTPPDRDPGLYRFMIENIDEVIYLVDAAADQQVSGAVRFVSPKVQTLLGYDPEEFVKDSSLWFRSLHPDDVRQVIESTKAIFAQKAPAVRMYRLRHRRTGAYHWFEDKVMPRLDASGEVAGIFGVARDVTEELLSRDALQVSEARFRHLVESSPDAILVVAADGRITTVNVQTEHMFGYDRRALVGQSVDVLVPERLREGHVRMRAAFGLNPRRRPMGANVSLTACRGDGTEFPVEIALSPLVAAEGVITIVTVRDLTERRGQEAHSASATQIMHPSVPTVLVVEEEDAVRELLATVLEREGYRVLKARQSAEALVMSRAHRGAIDLLLTDIRMPRSGVSVLVGELREDRAALKVLYTCTPTADTSQNLARVEPEAVLLEKPFTPARLVATVRAVLTAPPRASESE